MKCLFLLLAKVKCLFDSLIGLNVSSTGCGGTLTYVSGSFTSPSYPRNHPVAQVCTWHIDVPVRRRVQVQFTDMNIQDSAAMTGCANNYVALYDGNQASGTPVGTYCGSVSVHSNCLTPCFQDPFTK